MDIYSDVTKAFVKVLGIQPGNDTLSDLGTFPIGPNGFCYINKTAESFQLLFSIPAAHGASQITIDSLDVKWSLVDKRFTRGYYPQQGGQAKK